MVSGGCSRLLSCLSASLSVRLLSVYSLFLLVWGRVSVHLVPVSLFIWMSVSLFLSLFLYSIHPPPPSLPLSTFSLSYLPSSLLPSPSPSLLPSLTPPPLISLSISFGRSVGLRRPMREEKVAVRGRWRPLAFVLALSSAL